MWRGKQSQCQLHHWWAVWGRVEIMVMTVSPASLEQCWTPGISEVAWNCDAIRQLWKRLLSAYEHIWKRKRATQWKPQSSEQQGQLRHRENEVCTGHGGGGGGGRTRLRCFLLRCLLGTDCNRLHVSLCETLEVVIELGWTRPMTRARWLEQKGQRLEFIGLPFGNPAAFDHLQQITPDR